MASKLLEEPTPTPRNLRRWGPIFWSLSLGVGLLGILGCGSGGGSGGLSSSAPVAPATDVTLDTAEAILSILNGAGVTVEDFVVVVNPSSLAVGSSAEVSAWIRLSDGTTLDASNVLQWEVAPNSVATLQTSTFPPTLLAVASGNATVTASWPGPVPTQVGIPSTTSIGVSVFDPSASGIRLNAGGGNVSASGITFQGDQLATATDPGFTGGTPYTNNVPIASTATPELYQTLRYGSFGFNAPVPNGAYEVRLHYAEIAPNFIANSRIFDISIENVVVDTQFDIAAEFGVATAVVRTHFVQVNDGRLDIEWSPTVNNAVVCAVELLPLNQLPPTAVVELQIQPSNLLVDLGAVNVVATAGYNVGPNQDVTASTQWSSSDPNVLRVDAPGRCTALSFGTVTLTASFGGLTTSASVEISNLSVAVELGNSTHTWESQLGGVVWLPTRASAMRHASAFAEYPAPVLVCIKPDERSFGYRFDLDLWETTTNNFGWFSWDGSDEGEPPTLDQFFQIYGTANAEFILTLPMPRVLSSTPSGGQGYPWQTPEFYAAQCQYLFGTADSATVYNALPEALDFSNTAASFNWANLRAKRGHVDPYPCEALLLAGEPYFGEGWSEGVDYGARAELYRQLIRARGVDLPYGVHVHYHSATEHDWFDPLFNALDPADPPSYLDLFHFYTLPASPDWERAYAVSEKVEGFTFWWQPTNQWDSDYSQFLWTFDNTRTALANRGLDPNLFRLGFSEHGIRLETPFQYNDMQGGLHWALWLSQMMKRNAAWDSMWNLGAEGFATAQLQSVSGNLTRTPAFYVYQMAQKFLGLQALATNASSPQGETTSQAVWGNNSPCTFPWLVVQAFASPTSNEIHLFCVNHHPTATFTLSGSGTIDVASLQITEWEQLRGDFYTSENPLGAVGSEPLQSQLIVKGANDPLAIPPISVVRIVLTP